MSARVERSGRVKSGYDWHYTFQEPSTIAVVTQWRVSSTGVITSDTYGSCGFEIPVDVAPLLGLDSDRVVALALEYGAEALLERLSEPRPSPSTTYQVRESPVEAPDCYSLHNGIEMDPRTRSPAARGRLVHRHADAATVRHARGVLTTGGPTSPTPRSVAVSPNGQWLAIASANDPDHEPPNRLEQGEHRIVPCEPLLPMCLREAPFTRDASPAAIPRELQCRPRA